MRCKTPPLRFIGAVGAPRIFPTMDDFARCRRPTTAGRADLAAAAAAAAGGKRRRRGGGGPRRTRGSGHKKGTKRPPRPHEGASAGVPIPVESGQRAVRTVAGALSLMSQWGLGSARRAPAIEARNGGGIVARAHGRHTRISATKARLRSESTARRAPCGALARRQPACTPTYRLAAGRRGGSRRVCLARSFTLPILPRPRSVRPL